MAGTVTNERTCEVLKNFQARVTCVESILAAHTRQLIRVHEDINGLHMDDLRRETMPEQMGIHRQRIEKHLNLTDA